MTSFPYYNTHNLRNVTEKDKKSLNFLNYNFYYCETCNNYFAIYKTRIKTYVSKTLEFDCETTLLKCHDYIIKNII